MLINASSFNTLNNIQQSYAIKPSSKAEYEKSTTPIKNNTEIEDKAEISSEAKDLYNKELTDEEKKKVKELEQRDTEVRTHEQAHIAAGGSIITSSAQYTYELGPDNKRYAKEGEVKLSTSKEETPEKTIEKAEKIKRAALAPSEPSTQDLKVAQKAEQMIQQANAEIQKEEK